MAFEKFTAYGRGHRPICSLRKQGQIGFNGGAIRRFGLVTGFVVLYYDRDTNRLGMRLNATPQEEGSVKLVVRPNNAYVSAKSLLEFYSIPYREKTISFAVEWDESERMIVIDLTKPIHHRASQSAKAPGDAAGSDCGDDNLKERRLMTEA